jgi:predicted Zn-dependent protease
MAINDRLLQMLMQKNPDMSFAIQQSFPFQDTYADALPLGPLMELNAANDQNTFTAERATQSLDFWRDAAQQILSAVDSSGSETVLRSYSHDASAAANLLAAHNFDLQAEETYRLATQLWPGNPESVGGLANLLTATDRQAEAQQLLDNFSKQYPDLRKTLQSITAGITIAGAQSSTK